MDAAAAAPHQCMQAGVTRSLDRTTCMDGVLIEEVGAATLRGSRHGAACILDATGTAGAVGIATARGAVSVALYVQEPCMREFFSAASAESGAEHAFTAR